MAALCGRNRGRDEVPHSDGRCPAPACGIYALPGLEPILRELSPNWSGAVGLVELSGKVVEHEHGYRAERAHTVALAMIGQGRVLLTDAPEVLATAFGDPVHALARWGVRLEPLHDVRATIADFLESRAEPTWT